MVEISRQSSTSSSSIARTRILILDCDNDSNRKTSCAPLLRERLNRTGIALDTTPVYLVKPEKWLLRNSQGIIITGSGSSVYENKGWISNLLKTIETIDKLSIPTLGICFGHQAISYAFGGKVVSSGGYELGFKEITLTEEGKSNFVLRSLPEKVMVYQSHGDIVESLPKGSSIFAKSEVCIEAYGINKFTCVQFHPEMLPETAHIVARRDGKDLNSLMNGVRDDYIKPVEVLTNFVQHLRTQT